MPLPSLGRAAGAGLVGGPEPRRANLSHRGPTLIPKGALSCLPGVIGFQHLRKVNCGSYSGHTCARCHPLPDLSIRSPCDSSDESVAGAHCERFVVYQTFNLKRSQA